MKKKRKIITILIISNTLVCFGHAKATLGMGGQPVLCSVADPGCFIRDPDPTIAPSRIRIPDPGGKKAPDPGSDLFFYPGY
jgi:hypothetical protein